MTDRLLLELRPEPAKPPEHLASHEWLVTNGLGGYASGTVDGSGTRRYHGLFIPNLPAPHGRTALVPAWGEELVYGGSRHSLHGTGSFRSFALDWHLPVWTLSCGGRTLRKRILMPHGQNSVYIEYRLFEGEKVLLHLTPYVALRGHDGALLASGAHPYHFLFEEDRFKALPPDGNFALKIGLVSGGIFTHEDSTGRFFYPVERSRGLDSEEVLPAPGFFTSWLEPGKSVVCFASIEPHGDSEVSFDQLWDAEIARQKRLLALAPEPLKRGFAAHLVSAVDQFLVIPETRAVENLRIETSGEHVRSVIAGYHWFTDWGRDTMISLEGLCVCTNRLDEAKAVLRTFANYVHDGLLPNHFPEGASAAIYNTADATLWYFHALGRYLDATHDRDTLAALFPLLKSIVEHHVRGTGFGIGVDPDDGLLRAGAEGYALTWMDAQYEGWVVTPRRGKPVEIQALWYNALRLAEEWARTLDPAAADSFRTLASRAQESFNRRFWFEAGGYLYDVVDGPEGNDARLRPNQIFALSLSHPILDPAHGKAVLEAVRRDLLTPMGLRTLAPKDPGYRPHYEGNRRERDGAYHQGLVWPWLAGHYFDAWRAVYGNEGPLKEFLSGMEAHLTEAGIGSISEIFDAEEPFTPRGCIAQAWSVAETLRLISRAGKNA